MLIGVEKMKRAAASLILAVAAIAAHGQGFTDNTLHVKQFPGATIGQMLTAAQNTCGSNTVIPCYLILDPSLAAYPAGTFPTLCSHCFLIDFRTGWPGGGGSVSGTPPNLAMFTAGNVLGSASFLTGSTISTPTSCADAALNLTIQSIALCGNYDEGGSDSAVSPPTWRAGFSLFYRSNQGGVYNYNGSTGTKSNRIGFNIEHTNRTMAQNWGINVGMNSMAGGESIGYGLLQNVLSGYVGPGQESHEGLRIQTSQSDLTPSDGAGGIWAATAGTVNSGTGVVTFGTPTSGSASLGEGRFIRDLATKVTGTWSAVSCSGSPVLCTITGTGFSALTGSASNPHTTWNASTPGNPIATNNAVFCVTGNDGFDKCFPVTSITSNTSLTLNLQAVGTQGNTGWQGDAPGSYALYRSAYPTAVDTVGNTFTAGDVSGIGAGHSLDQVLAYNGDQTAIAIYQARSIGRSYGGGINITDFGTVNAPYWQYGISITGAYQFGVAMNCQAGVRCPQSVARLTGWDPPTLTAFVDDNFTSTATDCIWADNFSDAVHRCAIGIDKNTANSDSFQYAAGGFSVDLHGNGNFAGAIASLNGGFGPYNNQAFDSELQHGGTYYTLAGQAWTSSSPNAATDPWGGTTGTVFVSPNTLSQSGGVYSGEIQNTNITTAIGQTYACSVWAYSSDPNVYFVVSMQGPTFSNLVQGGATVIAGLTTGLSTVPTKYTTFGTASSVGTLQFTFVTYTPSIHVDVSQVQCQPGAVTGIQVVTNTAAVSGNGLVVNGFPQNTIGTITGVTAGTGLSGGGSSGAVTVNLQGALPNGETATAQAAHSNDSKVATDSYVDQATVNTVVDTTTPVSVSASLGAEFHYNENATAATAVTYNLPTAASGKQFCFSNANNGSAADSGVLTIATSASGQVIIFSDGTLSATGGNVTSGGAAGDAACVAGVDGTHWMFYAQRGTWTKH